MNIPGDGYLLNSEGTTESMAKLTCKSSTSHDIWHLLGFDSGRAIRIPHRLPLHRGPSKYMNTDFIKTVKHIPCNISSIFCFRTWRFLFTKNDYSVSLSHLRNIMKTKVKVFSNFIHINNTNLKLLRWLFLNRGNKYQNITCAQNYSFIRCNLSRKDEQLSSRTD